jgi:hypothetical protein
MWDFFEAEGWFAHFADTLAESSDVLGAKVCVEAEGVFQFEDRLGSDARDENLVQALEGVMVALEAGNTLLDGEAGLHGFFHRA